MQDRENLPRIKERKKKKKKKAGLAGRWRERERVFVVSIKHLGAACLKFLDSSFA